MFKKIIDFFIENTILVNLITVMLFLIGGFSAYILKKDTFPDVSFDMVTITTAYPGSSPEDVETLVSIPIERKVKSIEGIEELNVMSGEGSSIVWIRVDPDYEMSEIIDDLRSAVDSVDDLPEEAKAPVITEQKNTNRGILFVPLAGEDESKLRLYSKMLRDKIETVQGVARVDLDGREDEEIRISINPEKLNQYQLTVGEVADAIRGRNLNLSAGKIQGDESEIMVRTVSEFQNTQEVEQVVVRSNSAGKNVQIKDVASVSREVPEGSILVRSNGKRAIYLQVRKKKDADILRTTEGVKKVVTKFFKENNIKDVEYRYTDELAFYVKRRLGVLTQNGLFGLVFVFICLMLFLNFRTSFLTSLGAPLAFCAAFALMDTFGITLTLISMFGLILVLGMLVDDAIIVSEHFYQKVEDGLSAKEAAKLAAYETIQPVTATILTTMIAFSSLFFMGGIMGKFLWHVPAIVILCLAASLFECFLILPNHLAEFGESRKKQERSVEKREPWYQGLLNFYGKSLDLFLQSPFKVVFVFLIIFVASLFLAKRMPFELFPGDDVRQLVVSVKGKVGSSLDISNNVMKDLENFSLEELKKDELDQIKTWVGKTVGDHGGGRRGAHYGALMMYLTAPDQRVRSTDQIVQALNNGFQKISKKHGYDITIDKRQGGPPKGKPVAIELYSDSLEDLKVASRQVLEKLKNLKGVISPEIDFEEGKKQIIVKVDDAEARRLGLSTRQIAFEIRRALAGDAITTIRESDSDVDVVVILDKESRKNLDKVRTLFVQNRFGNRIGLNKLVSFEEVPGAFIIRRKDTKRTIMVWGSLKRSVLTPTEVAKKIGPSIRKIVSQYKGMDFVFGGENKDTKESMMRLVKAASISLFGIFFVLVAMFRSLTQPLIIMSTIPMGFIGVVFTFSLSGFINKIFDLLIPETLGFLAMMGVVGLVGVVVNDSIVLVNFINKRISEDPSDLIAGVKKAAMSRFRAVLLTTVTTVTGLLPIALSKGGDPFLKPMAWSFAGGLFFATAVTLVFIPCITLANEYIKNRVKQLLGSRT